MARLWPEYHFSLKTKQRKTKTKTRALGEMKDCGRFSANGSKCIRDIYHTKNKGAMKDDQSHTHSKAASSGQRWDNFSINKYNNCNGLIHQIYINP